MATVKPPVSSPFRATRLWNQLLSSFKEGMELKRKRWRLKSYDQCFSGADAIQWLYSYLQNHPSYGAHVTREQAFMLLQKFLENNVFQGVVEKNSKKFQDTNHLYRFLDVENTATNCKTKEDSKNYKDDKENFNSRNSSLTNLMRTISKRNSKFFGEASSQESLKHEDLKQKSGSCDTLLDLCKNNQPVRTDELVSSGVTPLAKDLNHFSLLSTSKDKSALHYSDVSTLLFPTEDEDDDYDDIFETSVKDHYFTRSKSVQMYKRGSRPSVRRPLGTYWTNEFNKTKSQDSNNIENNTDEKKVDKKNEKKKTILNFGKTKASLYNMKRTTILGKRKSGDTNISSNIFPTKLKKVTTNNKENIENDLNFNTLSKKNDKGSQDSLSTADSLPRKAIALLGEDPSHIQEVDSYSTYYPLKREKRGSTSSSESKSLSGSRESISKDKGGKSRKSSLSKSNEKKSFHSQSSIPATLGNMIDNKGPISQSNPNLTKSSSSITPFTSNTLKNTKNFLKKARSFNFTDLPPLSEEIFASPKARKPTRRSHAMIRRTTSHSTLRKLRYHSRSVSSSSVVQEGYPFQSTESISDDTRLYKVPSTWSINTIGADKEEVSKGKVPEITAEDVEETWKSVVFISLKKLLGLVSVKELFDIGEVAGANIMKNVSWKPSEISRDAPGWLLSAMNCLIDWPNVCQNAEDSILQDLPSYPGFERDVYRAVKEHYHTALSKPLIPSHLYPLVQECADVIPINEEKGVRIMQHIILLLPCWNRRQLQLLTHFMNKVAKNTLLEISKDLPNRDLVVHSFMNLIVRKEKQSYSMETNAIPIRITNLLIDSYDAVFKAPPSLRGQVDHKLAVILGKPVPSDGECKEMPPPRFYCKQITKAAYEKEAKANNHKVINDLLTTYMTNPSFTEKERSKRLKQFQKAYPEIYAERFPPSYDDISNCSTISEFSTNFKEAGKPSFLMEKIL